MQQIDVVKIKQAVKEGQLNFCVKDGYIYCKSCVGEVVQVGEVKKEEEMLCR